MDDKCFGKPGEIGPKILGGADYLGDLEFNLAGVLIGVQRVSGRGPGLEFEGKGLCSPSTAIPKGYPWRCGRNPGNPAFRCGIAPGIPGVALYK